MYSVSDVTQCQMYSVSDVMYERILSVNPGIFVPLMCLHPASLGDVALAQLITPLQVPFVLEQPLPPVRL